MPSDVRRWLCPAVLFGLIVGLRPWFGLSPNINISRVAKELFLSEHQRTRTRGEARARGIAQSTRASQGGAKPPPHIRRHSRSSNLDFEAKALGRITQAFNQLDQRGKKGFIPFLTAGDPDLQTTLELILELDRAGATIIELGVPFSDPMADGPVIQRASERALKHNFGVDEILALVSSVREKTDVPIILFTYFNPLFQFGVDRLARMAKQVGVDGVLVTDLTPEEGEEFAAELHANDLDMIFLVAPTSTDERLRLVAQRATGFIYAISRAGVTGARSSVSEEAQKLVNRVRRFSNLPVAVGFGISNAQQVADVQRYADAVVVGSAIVAEIERVSAGGNVAQHIGTFVRSLLAESRNGDGQ